MKKEDHRVRVAAEKRERMRRRLFESALQLTATRGPATISIDDVIQAAEVSRGSFYKYFEAPDALFAALALEIMNEIIRTAEPVVRRIDDPAQRVAVGLRLVIQLATRNREVARFLVRLDWPRVRDGGVLLKFVQRDLAKGIRGGSFAAMPMRLALNIVSMTVLGTIDALVESRSQKVFTLQAVASALRALGVQHDEAMRLASLEPPLPKAMEGGLLEPPNADRTQTNG